MKKFVSMFLAVCALSSMSVNAFAQQADAINVTSDEKLKLSFGEETFSELLLPGRPILILCTSSRKTVRYFH